MSTYTVHEPPLRRNERAADPERFVFVRDGFHFWAFLLAPLWLLAHQLWLVLVLYLVVNAAIDIGLTIIRAPGSVTFLAGLLIALVIGFEGAALWRWTLTRRGWKTAGFVVGDSLETAERRFFAEWLNRAPAVTPPAAPTYAVPVRHGPPSGSDVIGLFPEPGAPR
jgi:hypothetical protein